MTDNAKLAELDKAAMEGNMVEADFELDMVTFHMKGKYHAAAGTYAIMPWAEYQSLMAGRLREVSEGSVVVPMEPTVAMILAANPNDDLDVTWRKMLAAKDATG